jgi:hypothetical protein
MANTKVIIFDGNEHIFNSQLEVEEIRTYYGCFDGVKMILTESNDSKPCKSVEILPLPRGWKVKEHYFDFDIHRRYFDLEDQYGQVENVTALDYNGDTMSVPDINKIYKAVKTNSWVEHKLVLKIEELERELAEKCKLLSTK